MAYGSLRPPMPPTKEEHLDACGADPRRPVPACGRDRRPTARSRRGARPDPRRGRVRDRPPHPRRHDQAGPVPDDARTRGRRHRRERWATSVSHRDRNARSRSTTRSSAGDASSASKGRTNICDNEPEQLGFNRDGGDAEYVVVPEQNAVPVPDGVDLATASVLTCAGMTAIHATKLSGLRLGDTAVVDGIGGVGILVAQAAAHAGARVIAIGDSEEKLDARRRSTVRATACSSTRLRATTRSPERVRALTDGRGIDVFFELVGTTQTMTAGIRSLAKGGRFVSTGYTDQSARDPPDRVHPARRPRSFPRSPRRASICRTHSCSRRRGH